MLAASLVSLARQVFHLFEPKDSLHFLFIEIDAGSRSSLPGNLVSVLVAVMVCCLKGGHRDEAFENRPMRSAHRDRFVGVKRG